MDKKRIILLCAMGLLLAAAIALGLAWVIEANEYAGYEADYVDIAEDVLRPDDDIVIIELAPPSPTPEQSATPEEVAEPDISTTPSTSTPTTSAPSTSAPAPDAGSNETMLIYGKEATTQIENSVPYYSVSKWSSNTKMLLLHFHAP